MRAILAFSTVEASIMDDIRPPVSAKSSRLLDKFRLCIRSQGLSYETEKTYIHWVIRFIRFHGVRHPEKMGAAEVEAFLSDLAQQQRCAVATQRIALNSLVFLFQRYLDIPLGELSFRYARRQRRMPTVFTHDEAQHVLTHLAGTHRLVASLLYGAGLRLNEALRLRIKDLDFGAQQITVHDGKGGNARATLLPYTMRELLQSQIKQVAALHAYDIECGYGEVWLPDALERKYPKAARATEWQFVFPATRIGTDPVTGVLRRHHLHASAVQRAVGAAIRKSGFKRRASCHTFRHSFATRLVETGYDIKLVQSLLGHRDIRTTEIYLHVVRNRAGAIASPVDMASLKPDD
ncbi:MAG: integron integrase [Pseudomonadota bacterium]